MPFLAVSRGHWSAQLTACVCVEESIEWTGAAQSFSANFVIKYVWDVLKYASLFLYSDGDASERIEHLLQWWAVNWRGAGR